jgi:hypothetical protein
MTDTKYLYINHVGEQFYVECQIHGKQEDRYIISYTDPVHNFKETTFAYAERLQFPKFSEYGGL